MQVVEGDVIGAAAGAAGALAHSPAEADSWLQPATTGLCVRIYWLLQYAAALTDAATAVVDAGWKRCREAQLLQKLLKVRRWPVYGPTYTLCTLRRSRTLM